MTVYVDDMCNYEFGRYRRMKMSHMIADTEQELHLMADKIGVARRWHQGDHYDIAKSKRSLAIASGAVPIDLRTLALMAGRRRRNPGGGLPRPEDVRERKVTHAEGEQQTLNL